MPIVDLRSDTVTHPTLEMRQAMATAELGDDVFGDDPTVNRFEALAAKTFGKEEAVFVASGTMGNLAAILSHAGRGDEAICGLDAHTFKWEGGGMAVLGGVTPRPLPTDDDGRLDPAAIDAAVRADDPHLPKSRLLLLENSYGARNGFPLPPEYFDTMRAVADRHQLAIHLDGARLFNAAVALGVPVADITRPVDSVTFCLSKGLCAPAGSVLCGSRDFIYRARRIRKTLGGGMRQAGVLAAAGLLALDRMVDRLADDHARARRLADRLAAIDGLRIDPDRVRTNIVYFDLDPKLELTPDRLVERMRDEHEVWLDAEGGRTLRAVMHYWVGDDDVERLADGVEGILRDPSG